jgi:hypothetical protein
MENDSLCLVLRLWRQLGDVYSHEGGNDDDEERQRPRHASDAEIPAHGSSGEATTNKNAVRHPRRGETRAYNVGV